MSETITTSESGAATGGVRTLLRLEGVVLFAGMTMLYALWDGSWWVYAILFLAPDLSFAAYLAGPKAGAIVYNAAHSYLGPVALMTADALTDQQRRRALDGGRARRRSVLGGRPTLLPGAAGGARAAPGECG